MTIIVTIIWQLVEETTNYVLENYLRIVTRWEQTNFPLIFNQSDIKWVIVCWQNSWWLKFFEIALA